MKAIVFGITGQDGHYLNELLKRNNVEVLGVSRSVSAGKWLTGDVSDYEYVSALIASTRPDYLFHFAADSTTVHSALFVNHQAIATGTLNILESTRKFCPAVKIFLCGSAMQFKNDGLPIDENTPFEARSPYSIARIQSVYAARYYRDTFGMQIYVGYLFNHDSPLRTERYVNMKIAAATQRIKKGSREKIQLGDISVRKEFNYAADIVDYIWNFTNQNDVFEVVMGSGKAYSISEWVECCFDLIGKNWKDYVELDRNYVPPYKILVSNPRLLRSLGYKPGCDIFQLSRIMMGPE